MSRADYAHWNEEQDRVWWEEEGKHAQDDAAQERAELRRQEDPDYYEDHPPEGAE